MVLKEMGIDLEGEEPGEVSKCIADACGVEVLLLIYSVFWISADKPEQ